MAKNKKVRCPFCKKFLDVSRRFGPEYSWCECVTADCIVFGMEGFDFKWAELQKFIAEKDKQIAELTIGGVR